MPEYTNPLAIPYAIDSDNARDAISTIPQQAAEKIDDLLTALPGVAAAGPTGIPGAPGWSAGGNAVFRRAGFAHLHIASPRIPDTAWVGGTLVCTVPAGYRPLATTLALLTLTSSGAIHICNVFTNGAVATVFGANAGSGGLGGDVCFAI